MKRTIFCFALLLSLTMNVNGQTVRNYSPNKTVQEIAKSNKTIISTLKKDNKLKQVNVTLKSDGGWYLTLQKEQNKEILYGVANENGNIVVPVKYSSIQYIPGEKEGYNEYKLSDDEGNTVLYRYWYKESKPVFIGQYGQFSYDELDITLGRYVKKIDSYKDILSTEGFPYYQKLKLAKKIPGYWIISETDDYSISQVAFGFRGTNIGLLSADGQCLLKPEYREIELGGIIFSDNSSWRAEETVNSCIFSKSIDGISYKGGLCLNNKVPTTPCAFHEINLHSDYGDLKWYVKKK